ncbi:hypothetical protein OAD67_01110 [bacterium]|mgnify:CR=1 FL=1|nr:hypothetical protein [bacterium]
MHVFRVAAALCVAAFLVAGAEAGASSFPRVSPSTDASLLKEKLLASKVTKATGDVNANAKDIARALRAKGQDGLFDGVFADAREHLPTRTPDSTGADNAKLSAAQRKLLWAGWRSDDAETDETTPEPAPVPAPVPEPPAPEETPVSAQGGTTTEEATAPVASEEEPTPRGFLANALLLNRLRAVVAGEEGAAQSLVASAALTSALRNLDPATSLFSQIITDVRERREAAQADDAAAAPAPSTDDASEPTGIPVGGDAADAILAAFRDAADDRARELLAEAFLARFGATNVTVDSDDDNDGTEGTLLERLDLSTLDGMSSEELEQHFAAALDAGFEGLRLTDILNSGANVTSDSGEDTAARRLAAEAYRALFAASLDAAGSFVKEKFDADVSDTGNVGESNMTGSDLQALLSATVEAAEANAASFVELGFGDDANTDGDDLSPEAAAALLDRVHSVLAAARGDFTAALEAARDANGDPIAWPGVEGDDMPSGMNGFLSASEIVALIGGARFAENASLRDIGVAFRATDDTSRLEQDFEIFDDALAPVGAPGDNLVSAMSGPPGDDTVTAQASSGAPKSNRKPVHERVGFQVGLPVAIVAIAALAVAARASGAADRAFQSVLPSRTGTQGTADQAIGTSTAVASGSSSVVRRTSTSTKIEM